MSSEQNKKAFRLVIEEVFNKGNFDILHELFAPDYVEHQFGLKPTLQGLKEDVVFLRRAFPDFHMTIEDMIASEDTVWGRMSVTGTNTGPFMGAPTGKPINITVFDALRFKDGLAVDHWGVPDRFAVLAQLELLPKPQASS